MSIDVALFVLQMVKNSDPTENEFISLLTEISSAKKTRMFVLACTLESCFFFRKRQMMFRLFIVSVKQSVDA